LQRDNADERVFRAGVADFTADFMIQLWLYPYAINCNLYKRNCLRRMDMKLVGFAAMLAAKVWLEASMVKLPPSTSDSYDGDGPFRNSLIQASKKNARAAMWAGSAALCRALALSVGAGSHFWHKFFLPA